MIRPTTCIAVAAIVLGLAHSSRADTPNEITAVTYSEDPSNGATTRIHVRGAQTPTFTVYKLEKPSRVVIDLPRARLSEALRGHESATIQTASTWAVSTIAAQQLDDGGQIVRVIVSMARPGRYDVKTEGNEVLVMVTARDAAPPKVDADALVKAQAEAERLRKVAADQAARADAAQKAVDEARRQGQVANGADLAKAKADAQKAKELATKAQGDVERMKQETDAARADANRAKQETDVARADANRAKLDTEVARKETERAKQAADAAKLAAQREAAAVKQQAIRDAAAAKAEADATKRDAERIKAEAAVAQAAAAKQTDAAAKANNEVAKARREADAARDLAAKSKADADAARQETERTKAEAGRAKADADVAQRQADAARREVVTAKDEAVAAKADAVKARAEADAARVDAEKAKLAAAADRKKAEIARDDADRMVRDAKQKLVVLDSKAAATQALADKARAANAAAEARDQIARDELTRAKKERELAEAAAKQATQRVADSRTADRQKMEADAKLAQERLDNARKAIQDAEARRIAAENSAQDAKKQLEQTRTTLVAVEQQRTQAESSANDAVRKRAEAEAAATDATRRRTEAEAAATDATKRRQEAEQLRNTAEAQRKAAEEAARVAKIATDAAEKQRVVAERSVRDANAAKAQAEKSLDELTTRRLAAEHAAAELEQRTKAEAKAQAQIAAARTSKATEAELTKMRTEAARLADERKRAEAELADRRKSVAAQQTLVAQLEGTAQQARDAANREEARRAKLAAQRVAEETALAKLRADRDAVKPVVAKAKGMVTDVSFKGSEGNGDVAIAMTGDGTVTVGEVNPTHVELVIDHANLAAKLERKLDVSRFGSPVKSISSFHDRRQPDRVRLIAELAQPMTPTVDRDAAGLHWRFVAADPIAKRSKPAQVVPTQVVAGFGAVSTPIAQQSVSQVPAQGKRRRVYRGATVDFDFKDAPLPDLLRIIADTGRVNIVVPDSLSNAKVTVRLKRVPWDQALETILSSHGLWYRQEGNLYRVADRKELDKEDKDAAERADLERKRETPRPEVVRLNYADAKDLKPKLAGMVSPNGSIEVDERQNALIINDVSGNRDQITRLALSLDTQTPQITIEARIVEARSTFLRQIGVQWGGHALSTAQGGNTTGLLFPNSVAVTGGNEDAATNRTGVAAPSDFAINLPASVGSGEGGAVGLALGSIGANFGLNLRLSALEDIGTVRIISAPKITVLNNKEATITQGVSIPIQVVSAAGTQTQLVQADLKLQVTPYVSSRDCAVQMKLQVTKNEPDFVNVGARGDPSFLRKEASTTMLVQDGDTSVLGGIYTRNSGLAYKKIPFFGDLPVIGWFFKNRRENDDRTEILVFITPKITNKAALSCQ